MSANNANFFAQIVQRWESALDADALRMPGAATWTYGDLRTAANVMAARLRACGVQVGDRVLVQVDKSPENVALYLGTLQVGAVYVPLNTAYTGAEVEYFAGDASPRVIVCRPADLAVVSRVAGSATVHTLGSATDGSLLELQPEPETDIAATSAEDLAAIVYTSGTTGRSKGAMLSHGNLASNAHMLVDFWGWRADDVLLHALPIYHVHGLFVALHCAFLTATPMIWLEKYEAHQVCELLADATVLMGVPTFYTRLLTLERFDRTACANMRLFISGSAPLTEATFHEFEERTGQRILERYGMSETLMNTSNPLDGERIGGTVGPALPGVEVRITDGDGTVLAAGEVGGIEVRGPNVFSGYWQMPEKTAEEFAEDGWFRTGDLGTMATDGRVSIVGRAKDLIISGGLNIYPKEIERILDTLDGVDESAVIGVPHPDFGEAVVAVLVGTAPPDEATVLAALQDRLARFKQPKRVMQTEVLPRNAMGKVQKNALRETFKDLFS